MSDFPPRMLNRMMDAALASGWVVTWANFEGDASFTAYKNNNKLEIALGGNGQLTEVKFAGETIPFVAAVGLVPLLLGMQEA
jgi:hypothetical protein